MQAAWIAACVAAGCSVLSAIFGVPLLRWKLAKRIEQRNLENAAAIEEASSMPEKARLQMMVSTCMKVVRILYVCMFGFWDDGN